VAEVYHLRALVWRGALKAWLTVRLGEVLQRRDPDVVVDASTSYQFAGVYCLGSGATQSHTQAKAEKLKC
jgi:hypothetical protein